MGSRKFVMIYLDILRRRDIGSTAKLVYGYYVFRQGNGSSACWPSLALTASDLGISKPAVLRANEELLHANLIEKGPQKGRNNTYVVFQKGNETLPIKGNETLPKAGPIGNETLPKAGPIGNETLLDESRNVTDKSNETLPKTVTKRDSNYTNKDSRTRFSEKTCTLVYSAYPKKIARKEALKKIAVALREIAARGTEDDPVGWLLERTQRYAKHVREARTETQYIPHPKTWFGQGRYDDELDEPNACGSTSSRGAVQDKRPTIQERDAMFRNL